MASFIGGAISGFVGLIVSGTGAGAFIARLAATTLLSAATSKLLRQEIKPAIVSLNSHQITTQGGLEYRKIVYGEAMASGPIAYRNTDGDKNQDLWQVIPLCQGRSEELVSIYLDGDEIPASDIDWTPSVSTTNGTGTGRVSTDQFIGDNDTSAVYCWWALGDDDQPDIDALTGAFADLDSEFRGRGVTYMVIKLVNDLDTQKVWKNGAPRNFKAVIKGRLLYDPRRDDTQTGGSGDHRFDDPDTWEYSDNSVLACSDYLINVMGVEP